MGRSMKKRLFPIAAAGLSLFLTLLALEIVLCFLPVNDIYRTLPVNEKSPVARFPPDRELTYSKLPWFHLANTVRINNMGFRNDQTYVRSSGPVVAMIGDSYVDALAVPYAETHFGRLAGSLRGNARVYTFSRSGSPLSQYLVYADYAREEFRPRKMIFVVVGNDFDESNIALNKFEGIHHFEGYSGEKLSLKRVDYSPSFAGEIVRSSRLLQYLVHNAQIQLLPTRLARVFRKKGGKTLVGNTSVEADPKRLAHSRRSVEAFFEMLPEKTGLPPRDVLFAIDGLRWAVYAPDRLEEARASYFGLMREHFMEEARSRGCRVLDLHPAFEAAYKERPERFELKHDGHWSPRAHAIVAQAVLDSGFLDEYR